MHTHIIALFATALAVLAVPRPLLAQPSWTPRRTPPAEQPPPPPAEQPPPAAAQPPPAQLAPPAAQPPATPPGPAAHAPEPVRSGGYTRLSLLAGTFNIFADNDDDSITRFAIGAQNEIGTHIGPYVSLFLTTAIVFHHYQTGTRYAGWVFDGSVDREDPFNDGTFWKRWLTPTIPTAFFVDSQMQVLLGTRLHLQPTEAAPYLEGGGGVSLLLDVPDGRYGGLLGAMTGAGYRFGEHSSLGIRGLWSPVFVTGKNHHAVSIMLAAEFRFPRR